MSTHAESAETDTDEILAEKERSASERAVQKGVRDGPHAASELR
jgi:hypothetical protein